MAQVLSNDQRDYYRNAIRSHLEYVRDFPGCSTWSVFQEMKNKVHELSFGKEKSMQILKHLMEIGHISGKRNSINAYEWKITDAGVDILNA